MERIDSAKLKKNKDELKFSNISDNSDSSRTNSGRSADLISRKACGAMRTPPHIKASSARWVGTREPLPETVDLRPDLQPVRNQGDDPTCVAFATACLKEHHERLDFGLKEHMSPQFIYNARANYPGDGMWGSDAVAILQTYGCPLESDYPYGDNFTNFAEISPKIKEKAKNFSIASFASVDTVNAMKTALYKNGVCIISLPVFNYDATFWRRKKAADPEVGGHCVAVVGYTKDSFILRNSWGRDWADNGYCYLPFSEFGIAWEAWTAVDLPSIPVETVKCSCSIM